MRKVRSFKISNINFLVYNASNKIEKRKEAKKREEGTKKQEETRKQEEAKKREEETRKQEEETRKQEEAKKQKEAKKREKYIPDPTFHNDTEDKDEEVEFVETTLPQMMDIYDQQPESTINMSLRSASCPGPTPFPIASPLTLQSPAAFIKSQSTSPHAESSSQARSSNASFNQSNDDNHEDVLTGVTLVARFLSACFPSMGHHLKLFVDFGCTSEAYLFAVSTWPADRISHFLRQVSGHGGDGNQLTEMDMLILQGHFVSYFKVQGSNLM